MLKCVLKTVRQMSKHQNEFQLNDKHIQTQLQSHPKKLLKRAVDVEREQKIKMEINFWSG